MIKNEEEYQKRIDKLREQLESQGIVEAVER